MMSKLLLGGAMAALAATAAVAQAAPVPGHPHAPGRVAQTEARTDVAACREDVRPARHQPRRLHHQGGSRRP